MSIMFPRKSTRVISLLSCSRRLESKAATPKEDTNGHKATTSRKENFKKLVIQGANTNQDRAGRRFTETKTEYVLPSVPSDWTKVWPTAHSCSNSVPLPLRQGHVKNMDENSGLVPDKIGNLELMKIPNFMHLTPPHIVKHCAVLKPFLTKWPSGLKTEEDIQEHYPIEVVTRDFVFSSPSIRDDRSRLVTMKVPLKLLRLDLRSRDKFRALAGEERIVKEDGEEVLILQSERCPTRKQNYDFLRYVLTALTSESKKIHDWEKEQTEKDWKIFRWQGSASEKAVEQYLKDHPDSKDTLERYQAAVTDLKNEGEEMDRLEKYKTSAKQLLGLDSPAAAS